MKITVVSMFPELFDSLTASPVVRRAIQKGLLEFERVDIKDYAGGSFRHIDDSPCGGGPGMILRFDTVHKALSACRGEGRVVMLSPKGKVYDQKKAREFAALDHLVLLCGHYEGIDRRVENHVDEMVSMGDYVLTGGEWASYAIIDSVVRLLDGALRAEATVDESHENGLLEYPQYTKPVEYLGEKVPPILLSGNHGAVDRWRHKMALLETKKLRPDMFEKYVLTEDEKKLLAEDEQ